MGNYSQNHMLRDYISNPEICLMLQEYSLYYIIMLHEQSSNLPLKCTVKCKKRHGNILSIGTIVTLGQIMFVWLVSTQIGK